MKAFFRNLKRKLRRQKPDPSKKWRDPTFTHHPDDEPIRLPRKLK